MVWVWVWVWVSFARGSLRVPGFSPSTKGVEILLVAVPWFLGTSVSRNVMGNSARTLTLLGELSSDSDTIVISPRRRVGEVIGDGLMGLLVLVEGVGVFSSLRFGSLGSFRGEVLLSAGGCSGVGDEQRVDFLVLVGLLVAND